MTCKAQLIDIVNDYDALRDYVAAQNGEVVVNTTAFNRKELLKIAHALNCWNANQPVSDKIHDAHYREYIAPIHSLLEQGGYHAL